jgi:hypothetical protein
MINVSKLLGRSSSPPIERESNARSGGVLPSHVERGDVPMEGKRQLKYRTIPQNLCVRVVARGRSRFLGWAAQDNHNRSYISLGRKVIAILALAPRRGIMKKAETRFYFSSPNTSRTRSVSVVDLNGFARDG